MIIDEEGYLYHYGILRKSGRYPWGSGGTQDARNRSFLGLVEDLRRQGLSDTEIARGFSTPEHPFTVSMLKAVSSIAKNEVKQADIAQAQSLKDKGWSNVAIAARMGKNESSIRALLAPGVKEKNDILRTTANRLKEQVDKHGLIDIGAGVELHLGVTTSRLNNAVALLKEDGYVVHPVQVDQLGTTQKTLIKVLAPPGTTYGQVKANRDKIRLPTTYSEDQGRSFSSIQYPMSISSKRVDIKYKEDGGADADGVVYVRPGVHDVSLGGSRYAQVRIAVNGTHFIKGMAVYKDDLPPGVDLQFNTNKTNTGNKLDALKPLKEDKDLPFGAMISRQVTRGGKLSSVMNIVNDEGDWEKWSRTLSSQMLSKQPNSLAKKQLDVTYERRRKELDDILALTNPTVRKKLLEEYADGADAAAVHLKAAALPRQKTHVILPVNSMKETEVYAPNFNNGERVVLIRFPHGGKFEIPELTVNNRNPEAKGLLGNAPNAIGIHSKVAQRLSGADFDGDTVLVIPNNNRQVKTAPALAGLKGFDPQSSYPAYEGMPRMTAQQKAMKMGDVSNLITDMTIKGANEHEIAAAVRHSMVVIDAEKHNLNWKESEIRNGIAHLKEKYQGRKNAGASTIVSRKKGTIDVPERKSSFKVDPVTGRKVFNETGASFVNDKGKLIVKTSKVNALGDTANAHELASGTKIEAIYADHSNRMKGLANEARLAAMHSKGTPYSPSAAKTYAAEVTSLNSKLNIALRNAPLERQSQVLANGVVSQKRAANPEMEKSELKKVKAQALNDARTRTGAAKERVQITDSEWAAIQAGAISPSKLSKILDNADMTVVREHATPKSKVVMTSTKTQRAHQMLAAGYTQAEVAEALGVSLTTLKNSVSE